MYYSLVHYPELNSPGLLKYKSKYDPYDNLIGPHITVIFPVPDSIGEEQLTNHINNVLSHWKTFDITLKGLEKSWDHWLFLLVCDGKEQITKLHDELYSGILSPYLRQDIEFIPHIALGLFANKDYDLRDPKEKTFNSELYDKALKEAESLNFNFEITISKFTLITINNEFTKIIESKDFLLNP